MTGCSGTLLTRPCSCVFHSYASDVTSGMSDGYEGLSASERSVKPHVKRAVGKLFRRRARCRLRIISVRQQATAFFLFTMHLFCFFLEIGWTLFTKFTRVFFMNKMDCSKVFFEKPATVYKRFPKYQTLFLLGLI